MIVNVLGNMYKCYFECDLFFSLLIHIHLGDVVASSSIKFVAGRRTRPQFVDY